MIEAISYDAVKRAKTLNMSSSLIANMAERITNTMLHLPKEVGWLVGQLGG